MVGAGIERCAETGERFSYIQHADVVDLARGARCEQCGDVAVSNVLRAQAFGRTRFAFPSEITGDQQW